MLIPLDGRGALYRQLARGLRREIRAGALRPGSRVPGTRRLGRELGVSRTVVLAAFDQLIAEGYIESRLRSGTFVSRTLPDIPLAVPSANGGAKDADRPFSPRWGRAGKRLVQAARRGISLARPRGSLDVDFQYGSVEPDPSALAELKRLHTQCLDAGLFDYGEPAGDALLREQLSEHLRQERGIRAHPGQIVITAGSQQALDLCARLFAEEGAGVVIEEPAYQGARQAFSAAGATLVPNRVDGQGFVPEALPARAGSIRLIYVTPSHQFPTGAVMPVDRRLALLDWAVRNRVVVVEDDYDSDFRYDCRPVEAIASLAPGKGSPVVYLGTFSKSLFPSLRIGYMVVPDGMVDAFEGARWIADRGSASLTQRVLALFLQSGGYRRHLRRMSRIYSARRRRLVATLEEHFGEAVEIAGADAGQHLVVTFPRLRAARADQLAAACRRRGVGIYPTAPYYLGPPRRRSFLLGFSGIDETHIGRGVETLARAYRAVRRD